eukprot:GAFH01004689.1.p4 GENE.GAFH01004689.1~~GAFH01004689.1.p4  ORF type:complete len:51 (-),score=0.96 GAFH01004689.1:152-304(-)
MRFNSNRAVSKRRIISNAANHLENTFLSNQRGIAKKDAVAKSCYHIFMAD